MTKFTDLGLNEAILRAVADMGFETPSEVQEKAIPILLQEDTDMVSLAQTGTGKTAAYGIPLLSKIDPGKDHVQGLILAPTRELAQQIAKQLFKFTKYSEKVFTEAVFGGEKMDIQMARLSRPTQIVVATPGRLIDLLDKQALDVSKIHTLVLDEADEMLSMGFKDELTKILKKTKGDRNLWLFSATIPAALNEIIGTYVSPDAVRISVDKSETVNAGIEHHYVPAEDVTKLDTLTYFLKSRGKERGIVFTKTKAAARQLYKQLETKNFTPGLLEGDMLQKERDKVMRAFKAKNLRLLIATDVAARGIDVDNLAFVVHYQLPEQTDYYTHRSGRTARAGKSGISMVLANKHEVKRLWQLEKELGIKFTRIR